MSSVSATSSMQRNAENEYAATLQEFESIRALNGSLEAYLDYLRIFRKQLVDSNKNFEELSKINSQWIDTLNLKKEK